MAQKSQRVIELEEGIAQAVATLDESDGSRISLTESIDSAREILQESFGEGFEKAVAEYLDDDDKDSETVDDEDAG